MGVWTEGFTSNYLRIGDVKPWPATWTISAESSPAIVSFPSTLPLQLNRDSLKMLVASGAISGSS